MAARGSTLGRARRFLDHHPLVDGHNDLPWVIRHDRAAGGDVAAYGLDRVHQESDTDIPRLKQGQVAAQFWAAFVATEEPNPTIRTFEQIALIRRMNALHPDVFLPACRAADIARAKRLGRIASFISVEGGVGLGGSLELLEAFHDLGVRYMTLCHNGSLPGSIRPRTSHVRRPQRFRSRRGGGDERARHHRRLRARFAGCRPRRARRAAAPILVTHANAFALCPIRATCPTACSTASQPTAGR